jgi:hypothetical protein
MVTICTFVESLLAVHVNPHRTHKQVTNKGRCEWDTSRPGVAPSGPVLSEHSARIAIGGGERDYVEWRHMVITRTQILVKTLYGRRSFSPTIGTDEFLIGTILAASIKPGPVFLCRQ